MCDVQVMQERLQWQPEQKPVIFNQDGPCWWCSLVMKVGYTMCLNAGTVAWYRHPLSKEVLDRCARSKCNISLLCMYVCMCNCSRWWDASMDTELEGNPIRRSADKVSGNILT